MEPRSIRSLLGRTSVRTIGVAVLLLPAAWHLFALARIFRARFSCPLDLEYLESAHVYHAWRIAHRLPLYADPARGFATFPYPPLYWVAIVGMSSLFGFTDQAGRAVSIVSFLLAVTLLAWQVVRAAPSRLFGGALAAIAVAGICAGYPASDGSYDWTRSDTMAMCLVIVAATIAGDGRMPPLRSWATGLVLALSIYTKQSGVVFAAWLIAFVFWQDRIGGLRLAGISALFCVVPLVVLEVMTHGWFLVWLLYPSHQPLHPWWEAVAAPARFVLHAPFLPLLPWLAAVLRKRHRLRPITALWGGLLAVSVLGGALASVKQFTCANVRIPELQLAWPVGLMLLGDWLSGSAWNDAPRMRMATAGILGLSSVVLLALVYDTTPFLPGADRWVAAERLDGIAQGLDGGVVVTTVPMVGVRAGGPAQQPILATYEDARSGGLRVDYVDALVASGAGWVLTTDRYAGTDRAPEPRMARHFTRERTYDFDLHSLASWDRPNNVVLWRRMAR